MRKYLSVAVILLLCHLGVMAQPLDSLLKTLPTLKDKARIDCLIEIRTHYSYMGREKSDSAHYYSALAYEEATRLNYKKGMALSLLGLKTESDSMKLINVKKAIAIGEEINDHDVLGWAYYVWPAKPKDNEGIMERMKKSMAYFQKSGNLLREAELANWVCMNTAYAGNEEGFDYCRRSVELSNKVRTSVKGWESWAQDLYKYSLMSMSELYTQAGDYSTAMEQLRLARQSAIETGRGWGMEDVMSQLFIKMGQYDSSLYYLQILAKTDKRPFVNFLFGKTYFLRKEYELAQQKIQQTIDSTRNTTRYATLMKALLEMGKIQEVKKEYQPALKSVEEGLAISKRFDDRQFTMDAYEVLSRLHHQLGKDDSAYHYLYQYTLLKDSASNIQYLWKLNMKLNEYKRAAEDAKKEARLGFLARDNKIKAQQLKQEATFKYFLLAAFIALVFAALYVYRNLAQKRRNEKLKQEQAEREWEIQKLESEKKQVELEMQALRAQMNPHFIFNCLSSINHFILKNESKIASGYLTRFSRLMRMVLNNSQKPLISLDDELEMLELYIDMERLRFKNSFDYSITFLNKVESDSIFIPPLLLQPFCENAIWHGLMHKEGAGKLAIELGMQDNILHCTITDNGVGRERAEAMKSKTAAKDKSMGLKITTERLALINRENGLNTFYEIEDMSDETGKATGTKVTLKISTKESIVVAA